MRPVFDLLSLLTPSDLPGQRKLRIGAPFDGGYIMLDRLDPAQTVFSFGLSQNISYEHDLACRGHRVFMFDHTIDGLIQAHPGFHWFREGLAGADRPAELLFTLDHHLRHVPDETGGMLLKVDIEGDEWDTLAALSPATLRRFDQIVLELHNFHRLADPAWRTRAETGLRRLTREFTVHHAHANNYAPLVVVDGWTAADVLEVSLVRTALVRPAPSSVLLPTHLDAPNDPRRPDVPLWFYPWFPTGALGASGAADVAREMAVDRMSRVFLPAA